MSYREFRSLIQKDDIKSVTELLEKKFLKNERDHLNSSYEDYSILKDLIRHGKKDMIKKCIENGFPVNIDIEDQSFDGTPLHLAVISECPETVRLLLDNGSCIYTNNRNRETPLLLSAIVGNDQITDMLLSLIEAREYLNEEDISHFHVACMRNRVELVHQFLSSGTDIDQSVRKDSQYWPGFTPLHFAVEYRSIETVEFLVKNGADITKKNHHGSTPVHLAFRKQNKKIIDILLSAQCFIVDNPIGKYGKSHFHIACVTNNVHVVKELAEKQVHHKTLFESRAYPYRNALSFAIYNDCFDVLEYLLTSYDSFLEENPRQALDDAYASGSQEVVNFIINHIEKKMVKFQCTSSLRNNLGRKQESGKVQSKSSQIQVKDFKIFEISRQTKLHVAVLKKDKVLVTSILKTHHPSIISMADARGKTPVHIAFETDQMEIGKKLLDVQLKIQENPSDSNGFSHFHIACAIADISVVRDFLRKGVDVNSAVKMDSPFLAGYTPLHFAVCFNELEVATWLLRRGANYALKNGTNLSPFDFAIPNFMELSYKSANVDCDNSMDDECSMGYEDSEESQDGSDEEDDWDLVVHLSIANNDRKIDGFDNRGITLLHIAAMNNDVKTINRLANADTINKITDSNLPRCYAGLTPLHFAAHFKSIEAVTILLSRGADLTIQSVQKETAAHISHKNWSGGRVGLKLLSASRNVCDEGGVSLLHVACKSKNVEAVQHLLKLDIDVNEPIRSASGNQGQTSLHLAVQADDLKIVKLLLKHGANVNARDRYLSTPISLCKSSAVFKALLARGADPLALDCRCRTPLGDLLYNEENCELISAIIKSERLVKEVAEAPVTGALKLRTIDRVILKQHIESQMALGVDLEFHASHLYNELFVSDRRGQLSFKEKCAIELDLMKDVKIDGHTTLHDVLLKNSSEMAVYSRNEVLQKIVRSEQDLRQNYPIYAYLVILQFNKGRKRRRLLEQGKASLSIIAKKWIGDLVSETILKLLDDHEIQYFIDATSGRNIVDRALNF